ncbi:MAG: BlaI/MecI/CopY family transcriptional regulator [Phycisphaerales bacterium]|nr:BlaI/MecI/CopY family transcriptional regulator [Phycisphaerales bacterium]
MGKKDRDISAAELEVVAALWEGGPMTVREVMNTLHGQGREIAYTTVLTFLARLERKGVVVSDKDGVAYVYRAVVSRDKVARTRVKDIVEQVFDGAPGPLVLHLMKNERFTSEELAEMRALIERLDERGPDR